MRRKKIAIVGGGITGLSAAYYLQKMARQQGQSFDLHLLEKDARLGGKIRTLKRNECVIERGPDSFLARKQSMIELSRELDLLDQLTGTNPQAKKTYILHRKKLHPLPPGLILGVPTQWKPFLKTGLISFKGKVRAGLDLFLPKRVEESDEALGTFLRRRLGKEVVENIVDPLLAGIYAGDTQQLSLKATFPQFYHLGKGYRSIIRGLIESSKWHKVESDTVDIAKRSTFLTYQGGLETVVNRLEQVLTDVQIRQNCPVESFSHRPNHDLPYQLRLQTGTTLEVDAVLMAVPPMISARLLQPYGLGGELENIKHVSVATVVFCYNKQDISAFLDGSGFVIPKNEKRRITACTWTSAKWLHTAPDDKVLVRCYVGRAGDENIVFEDDSKLLETVKQELFDIMNITAEPLFHEITRWPEAMPQFPVGHLENMEQVRSRLVEKLPGLFLAGAGYGGVGIPDCVQQGKQAAEAIVQYTQSS